MRFVRWFEPWLARGSSSRLVKDSLPRVRQLLVLVALAILGGTLWAHGNSVAPAPVDPLLAVGGGILFNFSLACVQAMVAAAGSCGMPGIVGAAVCYLAFLVMQQACP